MPIFKFPSLTIKLFLYSMLPDIWRWWFCWCNTKLINYYIASGHPANCEVGRMTFLTPDIEGLHRSMMTNYIYRYFDCNINLHIMHSNIWISKLIFCTPFSENSNCCTMMYQNGINCCTIIHHKLIFALICHVKMYATCISSTNWWGLNEKYDLR